MQIRSIKKNESRLNDDVATFYHVYLSGDSPPLTFSAASVRKANWLGGPKHLADVGAGGNSRERISPAVRERSAEPGRRSEVEKAPAAHPCLLPERSRDKSKPGQVGAAFTEARGERMAAHAHAALGAAVDAYGTFMWRFFPRLIEN